MVTEETLLELDQRLGSARMEVDVPLAPLTTFNIGGPADRLFHARTADDLAEAILLTRSSLPLGDFAREPYCGSFPPG